MRCIYCNTPLAAIDYCTGCGADVTLLKRIVRISNLLYNRGLEKASVRDLSGAITYLKQSLKFNKENIDARNLLGLCYFETGEVVSALCEWVVSKNMKPENNLADYYMSQLQNNKNHLDAINQSIKKYNQSIEYCRQNHEDMAMIQLKKVVAQNPKLVKAHQLLALLYMKHQEYEKARRLLKKAMAVDNTNTTTLRYLSEIEELTGKATSFSNKKRLRPEKYQDHSDDGNGTMKYVSGNDVIIQPTTFRDSSTVATFINIALGLLLGGAIVWFLVVPSTRQGIMDRANQQVADANSKLASETARLQDLQDEIDTYVGKADQANKERDEALEKAEHLNDLLVAATYFVNGEQSGAVDALGKMSSEDFDGNAQTLFDSLTSAVGASMFEQYYSAGTTAYVSGDYQTAADQLRLAVESDPDGKNNHHYDALYYLGFAYYNMGDKAKADEAFNEIVTRYPAQASQVQPYITGGSASSAPAGTGQGEASMQENGTSGNSAGQDITIIDNSYPGYDTSLIAWTDPYTGLNYDMYGNLLG